MTNREKITDLALKDATILAYIRSGHMANEPWVDTLEKMVLALAQEKHTYFGLAQDAIALGSPAPIVIPSDTYIDEGGTVRWSRDHKAGDNVTIPIEHVERVRRAGD